MKRIRVLTLLLAATFLQFLPRLQAQEIAKAKVPFDFAVNETTLPAGDYLISRLGDFLRIQSQDTSDGVYVIPHCAGEVASEGQSRLIFDNQDGLYFLRSIATPSFKTSVDLPVSKLHRNAK